MTAPDSPLRVYIPCDTTAVACGADKVARAVERLARERNHEIEIVRNGSRGMLWLEPMVEGGDPGRPASPMARLGPSDCVAGLFRCRLPETGARTNCASAKPEEHPFLKNQERLMFARCGIIDPLSVSEYRSHGGFRGLTKALGMTQPQIVTEGDGNPDCAAAAAPASRPASSGRRSRKHQSVQTGRTRNTSSATPMRATAAPSPTA